MLTPMTSWPMMTLRPFIPPARATTTVVWMLTRMGSQRQWCFIQTHQLTTCPATVLMLVRNLNFIPVNQVAPVPVLRINPLKHLRFHSTKFPRFANPVVAISMLMIFSGTPICSFTDKAGRSHILRWMVKMPQVSKGAHPGVHPLVTDVKFFMFITTHSHPMEFVMDVKFFMFVTISRCLFTTIFSLFVFSLVLTQSDDINVLFCKTLTTI